LILVVAFLAKLIYLRIIRGYKIIYGKIEYCYKHRFMIKDTAVREIQRVFRGSQNRKKWAPTRIRRFNGRMISYEYKNAEGNRHRIGYPAYKIFTVNPFTIYAHEEWYINGILHRNDGAAMTHLDDNQPTQQRWYKNGIIHRTDGPAIIETHGPRYGGEKAAEKWYNNGICHRINGPAIIYYNKYNTATLWFNYGRKISYKNLIRRSGRHKILKVAKLLTLHLLLPTDVLSIVGRFLN